jgi:Transcriptional regulator containing an amidase domain and an AraC-type DNA-binding HTH domain
MRVAIPLFDGVEEMDFVAPFEVFSAAATLGGDLTTSLVAAQPAIRCAHGLQVTGLLPLDTASTCDLLVVPGGGWLHPKNGGVRAAIADGDIPALLARAHQGGATIASICTGAFLLAEAGLLRNRRATTHHTAIADLQAFGALVDTDRVVDTGEIVTAGGVTSGLELSLHLLKRFLGPELARTVEHYLEYPPGTCGTS